MRGGGRPVAAALAAGVLAVLIALTALARSSPAAAAARDAAGGAGIAVVVGCLETAQGHGGPCGVLLVVCGGDGRTVTSVTLLGLGTSGRGGLVVRVGGACPGRTTA